MKIILISMLLLLLTGCSTVSYKGQLESVIINGDTTYIEQKINGVLVDEHSTFSEFTEYLSPVLNFNEKYQLVLYNHGNHYNWFILGSGQILIYRNYLIWLEFQNPPYKFKLYRLNKNK